MRQATSSTSYIQNLLGDTDSVLGDTDSVLEPKAIASLAQNRREEKICRMMMMMPRLPMLSLVDALIRRFFFINDSQFLVTNWVSKCSEEHSIKV